MPTSLTVSQLVSQLRNLPDDPLIEPLREQITLELDERISDIWLYLDQQKGEAIANLKIGKTVRLARKLAEAGALEAYDRDQRLYFKRSQRSANKAS